MSKVYGVRLGGKDEDNFLQDMESAGFSKYGDYLRHLIFGGARPSSQPLREKVEELSEDIQAIHRSIAGLATITQIENLVKKNRATPVTKGGQEKLPFVSGQVEWAAIDNALLRKGVSPQTRATMQEVLKELGCL